MVTNDHKLDPNIASSIHELLTMDDKTLDPYQPELGPRDTITTLRFLPGCFLVKPSRRGSRQVWSRVSYTHPASSTSIDLCEMDKLLCKQGSYRRGPPFSRLSR